MQKIIDLPKKITLGTLYGGYLHGLMHSPLQLRVVSCASINTESVEREQGFTRRIALQTTSRRPKEVVETVLLRMQAEMEKRVNLVSTSKQDSELRKLACNMDQMGDTFVDITKVTSDNDKANFSALMKTISPFLKHGPGSWWHRDGDIIFFHDGPHQPSSRTEGPRLRHFRSSTLQDAQQEVEEDWNEIARKGIELPMPVPEPTTSSKGTKTNDYAVDDGREAVPHVAGDDDEVEAASQLVRMTHSFALSDDEGDADDMNDQSRPLGLSQPSPAPPSTPPPSPQSQPPPPTEPESKLAQHCTVVLGSTHAIREYDRLHKLAKRARKADGKSRLGYASAQALLAQEEIMRQGVLAAYQELKSKHRDESAQKRYTTAKKLLLQQWKIAL